MKLIDRTGMRFGRLTVLRKHPTPSKSGGSLWDCVCDCGNTKTANGSNLRQRSSCGCWRSEISREMGSDPANIAKRSGKNAGGYKHGCKMRGQATVEYKTWLSMKRRCYDASFKDYHNWGGRGVRVCERWNASFENFLADMGKRPSKIHSIDRIDSSGNYEPSNCRWATPDIQGANKRTSRQITVGGVTYATIKAAAIAHGIGVTALHLRLKSGMSLDRAFTKGRLSRWD